MKTLLGSLVLTLIAAVTFAQTESGEPSFSDLDLNGDGRLSTEEAQADMRVAAAFKRADSDQDGYLSFKEFVAIWQ